MENKTIMDNTLVNATTEQTITTTTTTATTMTLLLEQTTVMAETATTMSASMMTTTTTTMVMKESVTEDLDLYSRMLQSGQIQSLGNAGNMACGVFLTVVAVLSLWGNGLVILVLYRCKKLRQKPHNILLLNMAGADMIVTVVGYPITTISAYSGRYLFGPGVCAAQGFVTFLLAMVAMTSLLCLSLYRYVAVCRPWLKYLITMEVSKRCVIIIWIYSAFWTGLPLIGWNRYTLETFGISCSVDWASESEADILYVYNLIVFCYLLPIGVMCLCYYLIVRRASKLRYVRQRVLNIEEAACQHNLRTEVKISGMCFTMVFFYVVVWSPYAFVSLWSVYDVIPVWATTIPTMFAKLASTLNPYIYALANPEFQRTARAIVMTFTRGNRVHPGHHWRGGTEYNAGTYTVDRTKDGIFIGQRTVVIQTRDTAMF